MFQNILNFDMIKLSMFILKLFRCHPDQQFHLVYYINIWMLFFFNFISLVITIMDIFENDHKKASHLNVISTIFIVTFQFFPKIALLLFRRNDFIFAINNLKKLWVIDEVKLRSEDKIKINSWMKFQSKLLKSYVISVAVVMWPVMFTCVTFYEPYVTTIPLTKNMIIILKALLGYKVIITVVLVFGCDIFLIHTCTLLSVHFQVFAHRVQLLVDENIENDKEEMSICIKYHNFLYSYWKFVNNLWSFYFLWIFLNTLYSLAVEIIILASVKNLNDLIFNFMVYVVILFQYSLYCMPLSDVSEMALSVADTVYKSNWYLSNQETKRMIKFIIMRSQKLSAFTAGGLIIIDRRNLTDVFKSSISAYALARVFKDKFE